MRQRATAIAFSIGLCASLAAAPELVRAETSALMELSLEDLATYQLTSVLKRPQSLSRSAAAVYVITREEMRRSGYTSVAEALRMVPGVQVARVNSHTWAIGARGFNTGLSNKLLVLIDGRSVYSPLFSGVFWELRDVPVEDIERIEVIRGPGAAQWGANAVNGVINIITRPAEEAAGWTLQGAGGTEERVAGLVRYGGAAGENADFRLSATGFQRDDGHRRAAPPDGWWLSRLQGRGDWAPTEDDQITVLGEFFQGELDQRRNRATLSDPFAPAEDEDGDRLGASTLLRWERDLQNDSDLAIQLWYEYTDLEFAVLRERRHTTDLDLQHHFRFWNRNDVTWGGAYRFSGDEIGERGTTTLDPERRGIHLVTGFVQDQITLWPDRVDLTLGSKFEYNEFTGFEIQPSGRFTWTPNDSNTLWAAVSRAVRTPTRLEDDSDLGLGVLPAGAPPPFGDPARPSLFVLRGNDRFDSEKVLAYEVGYRVRPHSSVSLDAAVFYNRYDDLLTAEFATPVIVPASGSTPEHRLFPFVLDNQLDGHTYGAELAAWWQVQAWWRLHASYSYLDLHLETDHGSMDISSENQERSSPEHQAFLRSSFDLPYDVELDGILRFVDRLPATDVDSYLELDLRVGWRFYERWEVAVVGQNLLHDHHQEGAGTSATRVQRGVYGQLQWRWGGER